MCSAVRRALCGCCVDAGARSYLRLLEGSRCAVTQQLLSVPEVQGFSAFECIKYVRTDTHMRGVGQARGARSGAHACSRRPFAQACAARQRHRLRGTARARSR